MYRDYPHRSDKVRVLHNAKKYETVEDVGRNVPRIYASLDNKKAKYQSHIIEVEGMINNQTIAILIDSGTSHSYIDPKMVESFHFPRIKHGKSWLVQLDTVRTLQCTLLFIIFAIIASFFHSHLSLHYHLNLLFQMYITFLLFAICKIIFTCNFTLLSYLAIDQKYIGAETV